MKHLKRFDPVIASLIEQEEYRVETGLNMIASESYPIDAVMDANGSILVSKYTEGYPQKRYYGGCAYADAVETIAIERALDMFKAGKEYMCNVQPHAGSQANMAVYMSCLEIGDTVLAMDLSNGGHLTHGSPVNFSGKLYNFVHYGVDDEGWVDMEVVRELAHKHKPKLIVCGASAYPRPIYFEEFKRIADEVGALLMADVSHIAGLIVAGIHKSPVGHADFITTTTHKTLLGTRGAIILAKKQWEKKINSAVFPNMQGGALQHIIAGKAVSFKYAMTPEFTAIQADILRNSRELSEQLEGLGFNIVSGGTNNHLLLIDVRNIGLTGKEAEKKLEHVGIYCNKNTVPNETASPFVTSGIRLGTVSLTQRGMKQEDMGALAHVIHTALVSDSIREIDSCIEWVANTARKYPVYR